MSLTAQCALHPTLTPKPALWDYPSRCKILGQVPGIGLREIELFKPEIDQRFRATNRLTRRPTNETASIITATVITGFFKSKESGDELYVFTIDGSVVCFGSINLEHHKLVSLFVSPEQSGKGIGQCMLEFLYTFRSER